MSLTGRNQFLTADISLHCTDACPVQRRYKTGYIIVNLILYVFLASILYTSYLIPTCCTMFLFVNYCIVFIHNLITKYLKLASRTYFIWRKNNTDVLRQITMYLKLASRTYFIWRKNNTDILRQKYWINLDDCVNLYCI